MNIRNLMQERVTLAYKHNPYLWNSSKRSRKIREIDKVIKSSIMIASFHLTITSFQDPISDSIRHKKSWEVKVDPHMGN